MADLNPRGQDADRPDPDSNAAEDARTEIVVLSLLLDEHPIRLTLDELALMLHGDPKLRRPGDAAERAVDQLVGAGLVHQDGRFLTPSRAALYFERIHGDK